MKQKFFDFLRKNKKRIIDIAFLLLFLIAISIVSMLILRAFGVLYYDDEGMKLNTDIFDDFMTSWYGWVIIIFLQVLITSLLCFVPGASMAFILLIQALFKQPWQAFLVAYAGVIFSSVLMYLMGSLGGYKICEKLLGEEDCRKASDLLNHKAAIYFPLMMMFPVFPDDALVMIAGTLKMSMKWFAPAILLGRGVGVAAIIFGLSIIPYDKFTTPWHWIIFILVCAALIFTVFYIAHRFNVFLENHNKKKEQSNETEESDSETVNETEKTESNT